MTYTIPYEVLADSRLQAIMVAGGMLRRGVRVVELVEAEQSLPGWWTVVLRVEEDPGANDPVWPGDLPEQADPVTMAKAEAAR